MKKTVSDRRNLYAELKPYLQKLQKNIVKLYTFKTLIVGIGLLTPLLFKVLIDNVMIQKQIHWLKWLCLGYVIFYLLETVCVVGQKIENNRVSNRLLFDLRRRLWEIYIRKPITFYDKFNIGDLKTRIDTDTDAFDKYVETQVIGYSFDSFVSFVYGAILLFINWKLALFAFLMIPISFWMTKWLGKGLKKAVSERRSLMGNYEKWLFGCFQGWKEIKALNLVKVKAKTFTHYWQTLSKKFFTIQLYGFGNQSFINLKDVFITKMNLYFLGGLLISYGEISIGSLLIFMKYYEQMLSRISNLNNLDIELNQNIPLMQRVLEIFKLADSKGQKISYRPDAPLKGDIELIDLSFSYPRSQKQVLKEIQLRINPCEKIAVVGKSGCGKTTLIKLILGLYPPGAGKVLIDGHNLAGLDQTYLYQNIGAVMQDGILFNLSIKENLLLAKPLATDEDIQKACAMAYTDEFIDCLPEKYATVIGERGVKLSGGQKQRLLIARMLLKQPNIIIFDEATSSLDSESEKMINQAVEELSTNRTVIIVAHRLSSIMKADRVIVMDEGQIVGEGCHQDLYGHHPIYDLLFESQFKQTGNLKVG